MESKKKYCLKAGRNYCMLGFELQIILEIALTIKKFNLLRKVETDSDEKLQFLSLIVLYLRISFVQREFSGEFSWAIIGPGESNVLLHSKVPRYFSSYRFYSQSSSNARTSIHSLSTHPAKRSFYSTKNTTHRIEIEKRRRIVDISWRLVLITINWIYLFLYIYEIFFSKFFFSFSLFNLLKI